MQHLADQENNFNKWVSTPLGEAVLAAESNLLTHMLEGIYATQLLLLGTIGHAEAVIQASMPRKICVTKDFRFHPGMDYINSRYSALPIADDSIDVVVVAHLIDMSPTPRVHLAEATRVLKPEGHIYIVGFNPFSLLGWGRLWQKQRGIPWQWRFYHEGRLRRWLQVLNCEVQASQTCFYQLPRRAECFKHRLWLDQVGALLFPSWGGSYVLHAQKQVERFIAIRPRQLRGKLSRRNVAAGRSVSHTSSIERT